MEKKKRRFGDRKDGVWLRDIEAMHRMAPYILRNRADREAFIEESIDLTRAKEYLAKKNSTKPEFTYSLFQLICAAIIKTVVLRPKMNRFIAGRRVYQRNYLSLAFVAKNSFRDDGAESFIMFYVNEDNTLDDIHNLMEQKLKEVRQEGKIDNSTNIINKLTKLPRPLLAILCRIIIILDYFGRLPYSLIKEEPNYSSIFLTNLGSINLNAAYHHLNNFGTNSVFVIIGKKALMPYYDKQGNVEMRESIKIGITLDELIADGYYYSKSIKLFKYLMEHPELLERPANEEVKYD